MLLSDADILEAHRTGQIKIDSFDPDLIQPCSVDILLGRSFITFNHDTETIIDPRQNQQAYTYGHIVEEGGFFDLLPFQFALATSLETVTIGSELACSLLGKSSLARLGLIVHATAGHIDPGFEGQITLELFNMSRGTIRLWAGMKIGQLAFTKLSSPCVIPYGTKTLGSRYQGQMGATPSRSFLGPNTPTT